MDREEELYIHVSIYDQPDLQSKHQYLQKHCLGFLPCLSLLDVSCLDTINNILERERERGEGEGEGGNEKRLT